MTTETIDLSAFCRNENGGKYEMTRPFIVNGWRYATDGAICVRVPDDGPNAKPVNSRLEFPDVAALFEKWPSSPDWQPWPDAMYREGWERCKSSRGTGDNDVTGEDCERCDGEGVTLMPVITVGAHEMSLRYDKRVRELPNVRWCEGDTDKRAPLWLIFDGGQAAVMGVGQ